MSKICDRNYESNALLSVKTVNGVGFCPSCNKPAICHNATVESRALFWALSGDTGNSSRTIAGHMTGNPTESHMMPPSDRDDRGRCIRLLELIPEWIPRLDEMRQYDVPEREQGIVINSSGISAYENSWSKQIPLIKEEGKL